MGRYNPTNQQEGNTAPGADPNAQASTDTTANLSEVIDAGKDLVNAVKAHEGVSEAAVDLVKEVAENVGQEAEKAFVWLKTKLGYPLHNPHQNITVPTGGEPVKMELDSWAQAQIDAKLVHVSDDPETVPQSAQAEVPAAAAAAPAGDPAQSAVGPEGGAQSSEA